MALTRCSAIEAAMGCGSTPSRPASPGTDSWTRPPSAELLDRLAAGEAFDPAPSTLRWRPPSRFWPATTRSYLTGEVISVSCQHA